MKAQGPCRTPSEEQEKSTYGGNDRNSLRPDVWRKSSQRESHRRLGADITPAGFSHRLTQGGSFRQQGPPPRASILPLCGGGGHPGLVSRAPRRCGPSSVSQRAPESQRQAHACRSLGGGDAAIVPSSPPNLLAIDRVRLYSRGRRFDGEVQFGREPRAARSVDPRGRRESRPVGRRANRCRERGESPSPGPRVNPDFPSAAAANQGPIDVLARRLCRPCNFAAGGGSRTCSE
ncbi:hypothetical protein AAFF_G00081060 [Aldrovandia affinis]|uniref:Uncharacterized protein n=1 Tax=Aldrovandia affinis TaxID=143900 RepID=A0AAD7T369_9TELE|nr:hypothetical protein AAFF_G00081060 [Aldrovandia affinis]